MAIVSLTGILEYIFVTSIETNILFSGKYVFLHFLWHLNCYLQFHFFNSLSQYCVLAYRVNLLAYWANVLVYYVNVLAHWVYVLAYRVNIFVHVNVLAFVLMYNALGYCYLH